MTTAAARLVSRSSSMHGKRGERHHEQRRAGRGTPTAPRAAAPARAGWARTFAAFAQLDDAWSSVGDSRLRRWRSSAPITITNSTGSTRAAEPLFQMIATLDDADAARRRRRSRRSSPCGRSPRRRARGAGSRPERGPERQPEDAGAQDHARSSPCRVAITHATLCVKPTLTPSSAARSALSRARRACAMPMFVKRRNANSKPITRERRDHRDRARWRGR